MWRRTMNEGWPSWPQTAGNGPLAPLQVGGSPEVSPTPPPRRLASPRLKLETVGNVRRELARIYREARRGELATQEATRFAYLLDLMSRMIERGELERRVEALEAQR